MNIVIMVLGGVVVLEQVLAEIPVLKANSTFQLVCNICSELLAALRKPAA